LNDPFALPDDVRANVMHVFGNAGRHWLEQLPRVAGELVARWRLSPSGRAYGGGTHALVLPVTCANGAQAVLKVPVVDDENRLEAAALRCYRGDGAVLLYGSDPASGALLLERAEPGTPLADHPQRDAAIDIMCGLLRRLRRPPGTAHQFPLVPDLVSRWSEDWPAVHDRHDRPFSDELVCEALSLASELATPDGDEVLVNRDPHLGNVLAAGREPWLLIDPKPLVGEPAFDGGYLLLDLLGTAPTPKAATDLADRVAEGLGVAARRVRAWAFARAIENAMWSLADGGDPSEHIATAKLLASV
jgi:streptomycin 6-kinase